MSGVEQALSTLRDFVERSTHWREGGATRHDALKIALPALERQIQHQAGQRESELVTLLKDIEHCSDVFATFRPDLHARLRHFKLRLKAQEPRDDFPDDYEV